MKKIKLPVLHIYKCVGVASEPWRDIHFYECIFCGHKIKKTKWEQQKKPLDMQIRLKGEI